MSPQDKIFCVKDIEENKSNLLCSRAEYIQLTSRLTPPIVLPANYTHTSISQIASSTLIQTIDKSIITKVYA